MGWTRRGISRARRTPTFLGGQEDYKEAEPPAHCLGEPPPCAISVSLQLTVCIVLGGSGPAGRVPIGPRRDTSRQLATGPNPAQHVLQRHREWVLLTVIQVSHNPAGGGLEARRGQRSSGGLEGSGRGISEPGQS